MSNGNNSEEKYTNDYWNEVKILTMVAGNNKTERNNILIFTRAYKMISWPLTSKAPLKLQRSWFVLSRGTTTDNTGIVGLYLAINLNKQWKEPHGCQEFHNALVNTTMMSI